jgi:DNA replication protein DnaC
MRGRREIEDAIAALGRPRINPLELWRLGGRMPELEAWRAAHPGGDEVYAALLAELEAVEAREREERASLALLERLGAGVRVAEALAALRDTEAVRRASSWWAGRRCWLVLGGSTGVGKSVAAASVAVQAPGARWLRADEVVRLELDGRLGRYLEAPLLVVDDYGAEHRSSLGAGVWHRLLGARHELRRRSIITTNLTRPELRATLGDRLSDRIASDCEVVEVSGESQRMVRGR